MGSPLALYSNDCVNFMKEKNYCSESVLVCNDQFMYMRNIRAIVCRIAAF